MEALTMGALDIERVQHSRRACSEELSDLKQSFGKAELFWRVANKIEVQAILSFRTRTSSRLAFDAAVASGSAAWKVAFAAFSPDLRKKYCFGFLALAKEQNQKIADRTPRVSTYLGQYLQRNPLSDLALEEYDNLMGCAKAAANKGFDYDKAEAACRCRWAVFREMLTKAERAKFYDMTSDPKALLEWPPGQRVLEPMTACSRKHLG